MSKVFIETVGCPKNREDSERMAGFLASAGHELVFDPSPADVIVVNTCGFIEDAKRESIETIFDFAAHKEEGKRLIATGCLVQRYASELAEELQEADALLGVNDYEKLPEIVTALAKPAAPSQGCAELRSNTGDRFISISKDAVSPMSVARKALSLRFSSYLKIAEGCSNNCAYCVIPSIRGPYRSVPMQQLILEAESLAAEGCKELILIAQDVTRYGKDLYGRFALPELLGKLCASEAARGIEWIRLLYCYDDRVTDELIEVMAKEPKIVKYMDLPLQHISDRLLSSMRRASSGNSIKNTISRLRAAMPEIAIRTTFITGLPGETEQDFEELCQFVKDTRFARLGVFAYSREEGTDAAEMPGQVNPGVAEERRDILMRLQQQISLENNRRLIGAALDVLVTGREDEDEDEAEGGLGAYIGRTRDDAPEIDCEIIFNAGYQDGRRDCSMLSRGRNNTPISGNIDNNIDNDTGSIANIVEIGEIVKVLVTDAFDYDLVGELIPGKQEPGESETGDIYP